MATKLILFNSSRRHVIIMRHGSRERNPGKGDVWDFDADVNVEDKIVAARTVATYFLSLEPEVLLCSPLPRTRTTLVNRWPHLANRIETDSRLGIERGEEALWAKIDLLHDAYNTIPQAYFAMDPGVMFQSGHALLAASVKCATRVSMGGFGVLCTHFGILDMAIRLARLQMGVTENDGWLPGNGTQSGAFAVLSYTSQWELCHCQYYPVPVA